MLRVLRQQLLPELREVARGRVDLRAVDAHHLAPVGLLVVARPHHEHLAAEAEVVAGEA